jgi:hypothetical protein
MSLQMTRRVEAISRAGGTAAPPPLAIRRVDAIPIALPLKKPVRMADAATVDKAENLLVQGDWVNL